MRRGAEQATTDANALIHDDNSKINTDESLYWIKHSNFRLAVFKMCPVPVPSELLLSTHLPTSEGWTVELAVGLWLVVSTTGFEPTRADLTILETLRLNHSATSSFNGVRESNSMLFIFEIYVPK